jgi:hypothetical protein
MVLPEADRERARQLACWPLQKPLAAPGALCGLAPGSTRALERQIKNTRQEGLR